MATTAFSAGNITLSGWVSEATSTTPSPLNSFIIGIGVPTFVFNWTANTNISNHPNDSPADHHGRRWRSNNASLQIANTDSSVTIENGSGSTFLSGAGTNTGRRHWWRGLLAAAKRHPGPATRGWRGG